MTTIKNYDDFTIINKRVMIAENERGTYTIVSYKKEILWDDVLEIETFEGDDDTQEEHMLTMLDGTDVTVDREFKRI